jgi:hypothetical protein
MRKACRSELRGLSCCSKNEAEITMTIKRLYLLGLSAQSGLRKRTLV